MPIKITFKGLDASGAVEERVNQLAARLITAHPEVSRCDVVVETPHRHHRAGRQFHVRIELGVPGRILAVSHDPGDDGAHEDVYVAIRDSFDAARRQADDHFRAAADARR